MKMMSNFDNLPEEAKDAATRIAAKTGETPEKVAERSARVFFERGAVYRDWTATSGWKLSF